MNENRETNEQVTNEELMEHLKEIEIALGATMNGFSTLYALILSKEERKLDNDKTKLDNDEKKMLDMAIIAMQSVESNLMHISGFNGKVSTRKVLTMEEFLSRVLGI